MITFALKGTRKKLASHAMLYAEKTMSDTDHTSKIDFILAASGRWKCVWYIATAGLVVVSLINASGPETSNGILLLASFIGWIGLLVISLVAMVVTGFKRRTAIPQLKHVVVFLALAGTAMLIRATGPMKGRFFISLHAMNRLVERAKSEPASICDENWVGLYPVTEVSAYEGGVRFLMRGAGFLDPGGFAYSENGLPPGTEGKDHYHHLRGNWYIWSHLYSFDDVDPLTTK
jgi:hypothetical protein